MMRCRFSAMLFFSAGLICVAVLTPGQWARAQNKGNNKGGPKHVFAGS